MMDDFGFVLAVAFSGADLTRALWLGLVGSLFCSPKFHPLKATILIFLVDRSWPYIGMALSGFSMSDIAISLAYAIDSLPRDATIHLTRFVGLYALCASGYWIRLTLHRGGNATTKVPLPY